MGLLFRNGNGVSVHLAAHGVKLDALLKASDRAHSEQTRRADHAEADAKALAEGLRADMGRMIDALGRIEGKLSSMAARRNGNGAATAAAGAAKKAAAPAGYAGGGGLLAYLLSHFLS